MNGWLDANAEGIALALWIGVGLLLALLAALAAEWWQSRPMRLRRRRWEAYRRYCAAVDAEAARLAGACWRGPEARP